MIALWQNYDDSLELEDLRRTTTTTVNEWRTVLLEFQTKISNRYGKSLCAQGSGSWLRDVSKKVLWLKEKDDIVDLKRKLHMASNTISTLCFTAMM